MNKLRFLILAIFFITFSCKDDDDPTPEQLLTTSKGWKISAYTVDPPLSVGGTTITDFYAQFDACEKDEIYTFASAGTYKVENPVKCDSSEDSISESGSWTLSSDKKTLKFSPTGDDSSEVTIVSLDKTTLKVTTTDTYYSTKYTSTVTFTAQ